MAGGLQCRGSCYVTPPPTRRGGPKEEGPVSPRDLHLQSSKPHMHPIGTTIRVASSLLEGHSFQVNLSPSRSSSE